MSFYSTSWGDVPASSNLPSVLAVNTTSPNVNTDNVVVVNNLLGVPTFGVSGNGSVTCANNVVGNNNTLSTTSNGASIIGGDYAQTLNMREVAIGGGAFSTAGDTSHSYHTLHCVSNSIATWTGYLDYPTNVNEVVVPLNRTLIAYCVIVCNDTTSDLNFTNTVFTFHVNTNVGAVTNNLIIARNVGTVVMGTPTMTAIVGGANTTLHFKMTSNLAVVLRTTWHVWISMHACS